MSTRRCAKCRKTKLLAEFYKDKSKKDGCTAYCKKCWLKYKRQWRKENPEKTREYSHQYHKKNPDKERERYQRWRKKNPDKVREQRRRWREKNPERIKEGARQYRKENPGKNLAAKHRRRALKLAAPGNGFTNVQFQELCAVYGNRCLCCGQRGAELAADHVIPLSRGGANELSNIQPLCRSCNSRKHTKSTDYRG